MAKQCHRGVEDALHRLKRAAEEVYRQQTLEQAK
jgi:hypothetical protein